MSKIKGIAPKTMGFVKRNVKLSVLIVLVLTVGFIAANITMLQATSEPGFCMLCHVGTGTEPLNQVYTWKASAHANAGVSCLDCHGRPGFWGYMEAKVISGTKDIYGFVFKPRQHMIDVLERISTIPMYATKSVPQETCLFCHTDSYNQRIRQERIMSIGVRFRNLDSVVNPEFRQEHRLKDIFTEETAVDHRKFYDAGISCLQCHLGIVHD